MENEVRVLFQQINPNRKGKITTNQVHKVFSDMGIRFTVRQTRALVYQYDGTKRRELSLVEFQRLVLDLINSCGNVCVEGEKVGDGGAPTKPTRILAHVKLQIEDDGLKEEPDVQLQTREDGRMNHNLCHTTKNKSISKQMSGKCVFYTPEEHFKQRTETTVQTPQRTTASTIRTNKELFKSQLEQSLKKYGSHNEFEPTINGRRGTLTVYEDE